MIGSKASCKILVLQRLQSHPLSKTSSQTLSIKDTFDQGNDSRPACHADHRLARRPAPVPEERKSSFTIAAPQAGSKLSLNETLWLAAESHVIVQVEQVKPRANIHALRSNLTVQLREVLARIEISRNAVFLER
jgi:hypothetical protein